jgi:niacin transporter
MKDDRNREPQISGGKIMTRKITYGGLLLAISIVLPQVFHLAGGPQSGALFLPMHIPVLLAGLILGPVFGLVIGAAAPMISFAMTEMPIAARLPFMVLELAIYGCIAGLFYHNFGLSRLSGAFAKLKKEPGEEGDSPILKFAGIILSLIAAMITGRAAYALGLVIMGRLFGVKGADPAAVITAFTTGIIGIAIQLIVIPPILFALQKGGLTNGFIRKSQGTSE